MDNKSIRSFIVLILSFVLFVLMVCLNDLVVEAADQREETYYDFSDILDFDSQTVYEDYPFRDRGQCGDQAFWYVTNDYRLVISGSGAMYDYGDGPFFFLGTNEGKTPWYSYATVIKEVYVTEGITTIGSLAFLDFTMCKFIHIPDTVNEIGYIAFQNCDQLKHIVLPAGVTIINSCAFYNCTCPLCFKGTESEFEQIYKPPYVYEYNFEEYDWNLGFKGTIHYEAGVMVQDDERKCSGCFCDITNPNLASIGYIFFGECGPDVEWGITDDYILHIWGSGDMNNYSEGAFYWLGNAGKPPWYGLSGKIRKVIVHEGVTSIGNSAFLDLSSCKSIELPDSLQTIGYIAFENCNELKHIFLPRGVNRIYAGAFCKLDCPVCYEGSRDEFDLIDKPPADDYDHTKWDYEFTGDVFFDSKYTTVEGIEVCSSCGAVQADMVLPEGILALGVCGPNVFWEVKNDYGLRIYGSGKMNDYAASPFYYLGKYGKAPWFPYAGEIRYVTIEEGVTSIGGAAFLDFAVCESVEISNSVRSIGCIAFENCYRLHHLYLPKGVNEIHSNAFAKDSFPICYEGSEEEFDAISKPPYIFEYNYEEYYWNDSYDGVVNFNSSYLHNERNITCSGCGVCTEGWDCENDKEYWYEHSIRQGTMDDPQGVMGLDSETNYFSNRGREIYDPWGAAWHWLDSIYSGANAVNKEVWIPYIYQDEKNWNYDDMCGIAFESEEGMGDCVFHAMLSGSGKWVRYDEYGKMFKGWLTIEGKLIALYPEQAGNTYYYDHRTGLMAKGYVTIDGVNHYFDEITGALQW